MNRKKLFKILTIVAAGILITVIAVSGIIFLYYKNAVSKLSINRIDLERVNDGQYPGECDLIWGKAKVLIEVRNHEIKKIDLTEIKQVKGQEALIIPEHVIKAQSLDINVISGATNSSKIILKAVENALNKGLE